MSLSLPGETGLPLVNHNFFDSPPFQFLVVNPNTSVFIEHLSKVLPIISAQIAAKLIDLPRIDPELSIKRLTTVFLNSLSVSSLKLKGAPGSVTTLLNLAVSRTPSSRLKFQLVFCLDNKSLCSLFANFPIVVRCGLIKLSN